MVVPYPATSEKVGSAAAVTLNLHATWQAGPARVFAEQLSALGIALPVTTTTEAIGVIFDAGGRDVATIDSNGSLDDATAGMIAGYIALAINLAGGFTKSTLEQMVADAKARYAALSPEEREAHDQAQRESFIRGMTTPCEHGVLDFEQCPQCRGESHA